MRIRIKRLISQVALLFSSNLGAFGLKTGFCYPFFYCNACPTATSACPIRAIEVGLFKADFKLRLLLYPILTIGTIGILTGRAVCGWACPIGLLQRFTGKISRYFKSKSKTAKKSNRFRIDSYLRYTKYAVFISLVLITPIFIGFMFTDICPVGMLTGTFPILLLNPTKYVPNEFFYGAIVVFALFIVLIILVERGWCKYFCPVGAMLAPFNKISLLYISIDKNNCIHCNLCSKSCPMGIDVPNMNRDPECILCGKCIDACPKGIIKYEAIK